ncbi:hypothetical protein [Lunatibacter salilacus]|uniref:hypothetical protein n=1 Tax=Lunatibacter salilacus TaxID=2483804 RepID=UPI00131CC6A2|nr:hypothetical protein [Lunatibacter salilacus]
MKKMQKKDTGADKGVLSKINDNPDQKKKVGSSDEKKGIISKINGDSEKGK